MKCKALNCYKEAARFQVYCSKRCAPCSNLSGLEKDAKPISSVPTERSSTTDSGEVSRPFRNDASTFSSGPKKGQALPNFGHYTNPKDESDTISRPSNTEPNKEHAGPDLLPKKSESFLPKEWTDEKIGKLREKYGVIGMPKTESNIALEKENEGKEEPQKEVSLKLSSPLEEEKSRSMNLIDNSTKHLFSLMSSVKPKTDESLDPQAINAACNCAKNIRDLIGLKITVLKLKTNAPQSTD